MAGSKHRLIWQTSAFGKTTPGKVGSGQLSPNYTKEALEAPRPLARIHS